VELWLDVGLVTLCDILMADVVKWRMRGSSMVILRNRTDGKVVGKSCVVPGLGSMCLRLPCGVWRAIGGFA
jgi:hypothetical protein